MTSPSSGDRPAKQFLGRIFLRSVTVFAFDTTNRREDSVHPDSMSYSDFWLLTPNFWLRLLDPKNDITLSSLQRAAAMVGRRVTIRLV